MLTPSMSVAADEDLFVSDFVEICIKAAPDMQAIADKSLALQFVPVHRGEIPQLDYLWEDSSEKENVEQVAVKKQTSAPSYVISMVGRTEIKRVPIGFCTFEAYGADPEKIASDVERVLRTGDVVVDVVFGGQRVRLWDTFIGSHPTDLVLTDLTHGTKIYGAKLTLAFETK